MDPNQNQNPLPQPEPQPQPPQPIPTKSPAEPPALEQPVYPPAPQPIPKQPAPFDGMTAPAPKPELEPFMLNEPPAPEPENKKSGLLAAFIGGVFSWLVIPFGIVLVLHLFVFQAFHVVGSSMVPTLKDSDYLIISKIGQTSAMAQGVIGKKTDYLPPRNEIIVFKYPKDPNLVFVKRVIGLPGERVVVSNGQVRVFNKEKPEGFDPNDGYELSSPITLNDTDVTVPPHNVFVLGDNRMPNGSSDSREWGVLPVDHIIGNAVARLIPIDKAAIF